MVDLSFYKGRRVFITGHTGFKGSWLCRILLLAGAEITGYSLEPLTSTSLFEIARISKDVNSVIDDVRNYEALSKAFDAAKPEVVFHLAAQPIVRDSYKNPLYTYETNVMGTVNLLECLRSTNSVRSFLNVTTDKVYLNREWVWGYREDEPLDGYDPYSNSKSCSELVTHSYKSSFFNERDVAISTARAGNVIGGGDFAHDRIIPDCVRCAIDKRSIPIRNPYSTRPYQHVLEPLMAYLLIAQKQYRDKQLSGWYNIGPDECDCVTTGELADLFCKHWGEGVIWQNKSEPKAPHEAQFLKLDCSKAKSVLGWKPKWHIDDAVKYVVDWTKVWQNGAAVQAEMNREIKEYL